LAFAVLALFVANSIITAQSPPTINPEPASTVIGQGNFVSHSSATGPGGLSEPEFVAFDRSGDLWVSDYNNSMVAEYVPPFKNGSVASLEVGSPSFSVTGCSGQGLSSVCSPNGIAFDPSGNLWVADTQNDSLVEFRAPFSVGEPVSMVIGGPSEVDGQVNGSNLNEPYGIAFDSSGNLWVADSQDNRVLEYRAPLTSGEAASLVIGQASLTSTSNSNANSNMSDPQDIAFDPSGNLWVADTQNSRVLEFKAPFSNGEDASLVLGEPNITSYGGNDTQSALSLPEAIAFDHEGDLWVADSGNSRVLEFAPPFSTGMNASRLIGQDSYFAGGPNATQTTLGYPEGLTFDASGNLWVSDPGYARVLEFNDPLSYTSLATTTSTTSVTAETTTATTTSSSTSTATSTPSVTSSSTLSSSSNSSSTGEIPEFPFQFAAVVVVTAVVAGLYLAMRRRR